MTEKLGKVYSLSEFGKEVMNIAIQLGITPEKYRQYLQLKEKFEEFERRVREAKEKYKQC
jgi:predicted transcriptional regulator